MFNVIYVNGVYLTLQGDSVKTTRSIRHYKEDKCQSSCSSCPNYRAGGRRNEYENKTCKLRLYKPYSHYIHISRVAHSLVVSDFVAVGSMIHPDDLRLFETLSPSGFRTFMIGFLHRIKKAENFVKSPPVDFYGEKLKRSFIVTLDKKSMGKLEDMLGIMQERFGYDCMMDGINSRLQGKRYGFEQVFRAIADYIRNDSPYKEINGDPSTTAERKLYLHRTPPAVKAWLEAEARRKK